MAMIFASEPTVTPPAKVFIGAGSNIGDGRANIRRAMEKLIQLPGFNLTGHSSFFLTEPVGLKEQAWFVNCVFSGTSRLLPRELLYALKDTEAALGRKPGPRWSPRVIDLDILLYGDLIICEDGLTIPHPEMHRRRFVLAPLAQIAPGLIHPASGLSIAGLLHKLADKSAVILDAAPKAADL